MKIEDNLWTDGQVDDLTDAKAPTRGASANERHIGCPMWWLAWVLPVVHSKGELAVALYLYRLRVIHGFRARTIKVSNGRLAVELGIDRFTKYRALRRLATAGIIGIQRRDGRSLKITFNRKRTGAKRAR
jgi:hypothetical protein